MAFPMSFSVRNIILCIVFALLIILLLPKRDPRAAVVDDPFLLAHSIDPTYQSDSGFQTWSRSQWVAWLKQREPLHKSATNGRRKYALDRKPVNTVIIATPNEIFTAFYGTLDLLRNEYVWTNRMFDTYDIVLGNDGNYQVFRCPPTYVAVKLSAGKPIHLEGHSDIKVKTGNINYPRRTKCVRLN